jgi:hypothetical protein
MAVHGIPVVSDSEPAYQFGALPFFATGNFRDAFRDSEPDVLFLPNRGDVIHIAGLPFVVVRWEWEMTDSHLGQAFWPVRLVVQPK